VETASHPNAIVATSAALAPMGSPAGTSAAATPMAAPTGGITERPPALSSGGPGPDVTREAVLRDLMRQVRTDRERGA
jgi:hypothetical protein